MRYFTYQVLVSQTFTNKKIIPSLSIFIYTDCGVINHLEDTVISLKILNITMWSVSKKDKFNIITDILEYIIINHTIL